MILETFRRTVEAHHLLAAKDRVLAGVSGGGDSVALAHLLSLLSTRIPLDIVVAHVHHGLRGRAADEDQEFTRALASRLDLEFIALRPDESTGPLLAGCGEEAMRAVRHALLERAARENDCGRVALAHTQDDQAETVLMRLLRGSGRRGLSGMRHAGPGRLVRPMLEIGRAEARAWVASIGGEFREDETNDDPRFLRNRIRASLLPAVKRINPSAVDVLARTAEILQEEDLFLDELAGEAMARLAEPSHRGAAVSARALGLAGLPRPLARRVARLLLAAAGWLSVLLAQLHFDAGDREAAEANRDAALRLASQAGQAELAAWALEALAWWALADGRYRDALELARAGQDRAPPASAAALQLALDEAQAWTSLGDRDQAAGARRQAALTRAMLPGTGLARPGPGDASVGTAAPARWRAGAGAPGSA